MTKAEMIDKLATLEAKVAELQDRLEDMQADVDDDFDNEPETSVHAYDPEVVNKIALEFYRFAKYPDGPTAKKWKALLNEGKFNSNQEKFFGAVEDFFKVTF